MNLRITAIVKEVDLDAVCSILSDVFDSDYIVNARKNLTAAKVRAESVFCFSGVFTSSEVETLNRLGFSGINATYWIQNPDTNQVIASSDPTAIGQSKSAKQLILAAGAVNVREIEGSAANPIK